MTAMSVDSWFFGSGGRIAHARDASVPTRIRVFGVFHSTHWGVGPGDGG